MNASDEVIALLLSERNGPQAGRAAFAPGAQRLIRDRKGRVSLEPIETRRDFEETARITGCFRRGKAIRDPRTLEIIGYEMEEVPSAPLTAEAAQ
jgi:hypothetical protein